MEIRRPKKELKKGDEIFIIVDEKESDIKVPTNRILAVTIDGFYYDDEEIRRIVCISQDNPGMEFVLDKKFDKFFYSVREAYNYKEHKATKEEFSNVKDSLNNASTIITDLFSGLTEALKNMPSEMKEQMSSDDKLNEFVEKIFQGNKK